MTGTVWISFTYTRRGYLIRTLDDVYGLFSLAVTGLYSYRLYQSQTVAQAYGYTGYPFQQISGTLIGCWLSQKEICSYSLLKSILTLFTPFKETQSIS
jgi:hypothetical protein